MSRNNKNIMQIHVHIVQLVFKENKTNDKINEEKYI